MESYDLFEAKDMLRLVIHDIDDEDGWNHLDKIRGNAFKQTSDTLTLQSLPRYIHKGGEGFRLVSFRSEIELEKREREKSNEGALYPCSTSQEVQVTHKLAGNLIRLGSSIE